MQGMFRYHPVDLGGGRLHHPPLTQALDSLPGIAYLPPKSFISNVKSQKKLFPGF